MKDQELVTLVTDLVNEFLSFLDLEGELNVSIQLGDDDRKQVVASISGEELGILIGRSGANLESLQNVLSIIVNRKLEGEDRVLVIVDINGYRDRKKISVERIAEKAAQQAIDFGVEVALDPMHPADRRYVHMALADDSRVVTESAGEGRDRYVVVKPSGE